MSGEIEITVTIKGSIGHIARVLSSLAESLDADDKEVGTSTLWSDSGDPIGTMTVCETDD